MPAAGATQALRLCRNTLGAMQFTVPNMVEVFI